MCCYLFLCLCCGKESVRVVICSERSSHETGGSRDQGDMRGACRWWSGQQSDVVSCYMYLP